MSYIEIAELIYNRVLDQYGFSSDSSKDLNLLLMELKNMIGKTHFQLKHDFTNIDDLNQQLKLSGGKSVDLILAPNRYQDKEFILWLAVILENITDHNTLNQRDKKIYLPIKSLGKDNGEAILAYLNSKDFNRAEF